MMNLDFDWVILQYQDIAGNLKKGQFAQNLKNGSDIYEHVEITFFSYLHVTENAL